MTNKLTRISILDGAMLNSGSMADARLMARITLASNISGVNAADLAYAISVTNDNADRAVAAAKAVTDATPTFAKLAAKNAFTDENTFAKTVSITGDNTLLIMGNNGDIGFLKKSGDSGRIAIGSGNSFRLVRASTTKLAIDSTYSTLFEILNTGAATLQGKSFTIVGDGSSNLNLGSGSADVYMNNSKTGMYLQLGDDGYAKITGSRIFHEKYLPTLTQVLASTNSTVLSTGDDLNNCKSIGYYTCSSVNSEITNSPVAKGTRWNMVVYGVESTIPNNGLVQVVYKGVAGLGSYMRSFDNGNWGAWQEILFTNSNTPVIFNQSVTFANNAWNNMGDDVAIGDRNKAGRLAIQGRNGDPGIALFTSSNGLAAEIYADDTYLNITKAINVIGDMVSNGLVKVTGGMGKDFLPSSQGAYMGWNFPSGKGQTVFINHRGGGSGGFTYINSDGKTNSTIFEVSGGGDGNFSGTLRSQKDLTIDTGYIKSNDGSHYLYIGKNAENTAVWANYGGQFLFRNTNGNLDGQLSYSGNIKGSQWGDQWLSDYMNSTYQKATTSDERLKTNIRVIEDPLKLMPKLRGKQWDRLDGENSGVGFVAQDVEALFPSSVTTLGSRRLVDGKSVEDVKSPDTAGVAAGLHHEAILAMMDIVSELIDTLKDENLSEESKNKLEILSTRFK